MKEVNVFRLMGYKNAPKQSAIQSCYIEVAKQMMADTLLVYYITMPLTK